MAVSKQQAGVQLSTYADNVALPAFARRAPVPACSKRSISAARRAYRSKPAAAGSDGRTPHLYINASAPHTMRAVPISMLNANSCNDGQFQMATTSVR